MKLLKVTNRDDYWTNFVYNQIVLSIRLFQEQSVYLQ